MKHPLHKFGGDGHILHIAVANGFPPQVYLPLLRPFMEAHTVVSLPPRALWPDETPPAELVEWDKTLAVDLLDGLREHQLNDVIGVGHSFGAIATILAALKEPTRFKALILLDPTILPKLYLWGIRFARFVGTDRGFALAQRAERRRDAFDSVDAAYEYFKSKSLFADWPDETIRLYAETCQPTINGSVRLAWPPAWEAYYFRTIYTGIWGTLEKLKGLLPILLIRGGESNTLQAQSAARIRRILPTIDYQEVEGHGHLFPLSAPEVTSHLMSEWLDGLIG